MISEEILAREARCRIVCKWMTACYMAVGAGLAVIYGLRAEWYLMAQSLGTIAALWAIFGVLRMMRIRPVYSYYAVIIGFTFAAYTLGVACAFYKILPGYDKLLHMLSGTFTMMLALPLFYALKDGHRMEESDCKLAVVFCMTTALAVAGVWEIAEYILNLIVPLDPQCVQATGVSDTMRDMIVCTAGALLGVPSMVKYFRTGRAGILYSPVEIFIEKNLAGGEA